LCLHISATKDHYVVSDSAGNGADWHMARRAPAEVLKWSGPGVYFEDILQVLNLSLHARETYVPGADRIRLDGSDSADENTTGRGVAI